MQEFIKCPSRKLISSSQTNYNKMPSDPGNYPYSVMERFALESIDWTKLSKLSEKVKYPCTSPPLPLRCKTGLTLTRYLALTLCREASCSQNSAQHLALFRPDTLKPQRQHQDVYLRTFYNHWLDSLQTLSGVELDGEVQASRSLHDLTFGCYTRSPS